MPKPNEPNASPTATTALAAVFGSPTDCSYSLPDNSRPIAKKDKQGNPFTLQAIGEITIPIVGSAVTIMATVWSEKRETAEGTSEAISFSIPRGVQHSYLNMTPKSDMWYDAKDNYNLWRGSVLEAFLTWRGSRPSRQTVGGSVVRLVKKTDSPSKPTK